jgi:polyisoprenoid-binding protein YceI
MSWTIDSTHSSIEFAVKHMMFTTVRGRFNNFAGTLNIDEANPTRSYAEGKVEISSIDTHDANRDAHLRAADFFEVDKYPYMTLRTTGVKVVSREHYQVTAALTIKDVTREVVFEVNALPLGKDPWGNQRWGLSAETSINRKDFGLNWNVALETGGWLVGEQVKIEVELQAIKQAEPEAVAVA